MHRRPQTFAPARSSQATVTPCTRQGACVPDVAAALWMGTLRLGVALRQQGSVRMARQARHDTVLVARPRPPTMAPAGQPWQCAGATHSTRAPACQLGKYWCCLSAGCRTPDLGPFRPQVKCQTQQTFSCWVADPFLGHLVPNPFLMPQQAVGDSGQAAWCQTPRFCAPAGQPRWCPGCLVPNLKPRDQNGHTSGCLKRYLPFEPQQA